MFRSSSPRPALRVVEPASADEPVSGEVDRGDAPTGRAQRSEAPGFEERGEVVDVLARSGRRLRQEPPPPGLDELGDAQLVALSRAGDRNAFEVLYRRHAAFALNLAVRIQGGVGDVEDIVHDAFLRAHDRLDELREAGAFRGWLGSIVVRLVRSRLRRGRFLGTLGFGAQEAIDLDALAAETAGPETRALLAQIYGVLRRLPVDQRIAWTLRYVERHTLPDVAQMVDCSLATVKRRIAAAQAALDVAFAENGGAGG
ncbi:MAG: sigma-70 family RNA polymerase sigma factor [Myxococcales bacterium]|jgi:RNA polymerase sigma-70 factor (ECF subfamily)|nr:sigma-70 family RNA polymerase sigma factor [Myxococcales bacterium]